MRANFANWVLASLIAMPLSVRDATPISACGTVIKTPGSYIVTRILTVSAGSNSICIKVDSDYVTIDLGGYSIVGDGLSPGISDYKTPQHVGLVIRNGMIVGCSGGIVLYRVQSTLIEGVTVHASVGNGIDEESDGATLLGNISNDNGDYGIESGSGPTISALIDNTVVGNAVSLDLGGSVRLNNLAP